MRRPPRRRPRRCASSHGSRKDLHGQIGRYAQPDCKEHLGSAGAYMKIFELNKDQLNDPDKIKPGQVLQLP